MYSTVPGPAHTLLSSCFWSFQKHPPTSRRPFSSEDRDNPPGFYIRRLSTLSSHVWVVFAWFSRRWANCRTCLWQFFLAKPLSPICVHRDTPSFAQSGGVASYFLRALRCTSKLPLGDFSEGNPAIPAKSLSYRWTGGPPKESWSTFPRFGEYTPVSCLLFLKSPGREGACRTLWDWGQPEELGPAPVLSGLSNYMQNVPSRDIFHSCGSGPSRRLWRWSGAMAWRSMDNHLHCF